MAMKMFTNASPEYDGKSIAINSDAVVSVFTYERDDEEGEEKSITVLYGATGTSWEVKESYLEVVNRLNEPN